MSFNINNFKSNIQNYGYLPSNKFEVFLRPPNLLFNNALNNQGTETQVSDVIKLIKFRAEDVRAPGVTLLSADVPRYGVGTTQKMPFNAQLNEITLTMLSDGYGDLWRFWHNWIRSIFEFNGIDSATTGRNNTLASYSTEYKDNYATTMQIIIYDMFGNAIIKFNLYELFPTGMRETQLDWSDNNNLLRISVNLTFNEFTIVGNTLQSERTMFDDIRPMNIREFDTRTTTP
jgi:hypothetical protein